MLCLVLIELEFLFIIKNILEIKFLNVFFLVLFFKIGVMIKCKFLFNVCLKIMLLFLKLCFFKSSLIVFVSFIKSF